MQDQKREMLTHTIGDHEHTSTNKSIREQKWTKLSDTAITINAFPSPPKNSIKDFIFFVLIPKSEPDILFGPLFEFCTGRPKVKSLNNNPSNMECHLSVF
jgi:hypothetical protein